MHFPGLSTVGLVVVAFGAATALVSAADRTLADLLFLGVLLSSLGLLGRLVLGSVVGWHAAHRHEKEVVATLPSEAAGRAVEEERTRLSTEIDRSVRRSLLTVRSLIARADRAADPRPDLVAIQTESRTAMSELRRQLGLIDTDRSAPEASSTRGPRAGSSASSDSLARQDVVIVVALWILIAAENALFADKETPSSWLMSAVLALTSLTRRVAPVPTALAGAGILLLGVVLDAPVGDGFSFPVVVGLLLWSVLEPRPTPTFVGAGAVLLVCAVGSRYAHDPTNGPINVVVLSFVGLAAHLLGRARRSRAVSQRRAATHQAQLATARARATATTRREVARELHDVVSHAVSLVAVHAGAAELAWPGEPATARASLRAVDETVSAALADLDAKHSSQGAALGWSDVARTVARLRSAGLVISLQTSGRPPDELMPTVHRVVQESLTNVLKHASDATAVVIVNSGPDHTRVEVVDDGAGSTSAAAGYGLVGLEDRVTTAGGTLSAGPTPRGGFAVRAVLPHVPAGARHEVGS